MNTATRVTTLAPFHFRAFRFQWPADLATSCAFEMETLILSWYILVETQSVFLLSAYASLQYLGTLISPMVGVIGDRVGPRNLLSAMRAIYATLALSLLTIIALGALSPVPVFILSALMGLVRPSDMGMRAMLIGATVPATHFVGAIAIQRTTMDSARIAGAVAGAGLVAALGMGAAYVAIASLYITSVVLTLKARSGTVPRAAPRAATATTRPSPWKDLKEGARYVWTTPVLFALMCLAFVVNLTAFPQLNGLLPYVAKEIYGTDQTGLGYMIAGGGMGALVGSLIISRFGGTIRPGRTMIAASVIWFVCLIAFAHTSNVAAGIPFLFLAWFSASMSQVPMQAMILHQTREQFRGRVLGIRMLAIYGNMLGLLIGGQLISAIGYRPMVIVYCLVGIAAAVLIATYWRTYLWRRDAPANAR